MRSTALVLALCSLLAACGLADPPEGVARADPNAGPPDADGAVADASADKSDTTDLASADTVQPSKEGEGLRLDNLGDKEDAH